MLRMRQFRSPTDHAANSEEVYVMGKEDWVCVIPHPNQVSGFHPVLLGALHQRGAPPYLWFSPGFAMKLEGYRRWMETGGSHCIRFTATGHCVRP